MSNDEIVLVYDKECPVCHMYCQIVRVRETVGQLTIVDARHNSQVLERITAQGLDIDQGMVLKMGGRLYYGADAIHALSLVSTRSGIFNRINYWVFKSQRIANIIYPVMRACRNLLLKLLGKTKINNLNLPNNDDF